MNRHCPLALDPNGTGIGSLGHHLDKLPQPHALGLPGYNMQRRPAVNLHWRNRPDRLAAGAGPAIGLNRPGVRHRRILIQPGHVPGMRFGRTPGGIRPCEIRVDQQIPPGLLGSQRQRHGGDDCRHHCKECQTNQGNVVKTIRHIPRLHSHSISFRVNSLDDDRVSISDDLIILPPLPPLANLVWTAVLVQEDFTTDAAERRSENELIPTGAKKLMSSTRGRGFARLSLPNRLIRTTASAEVLTFLQTQIPVFRRFDARQCFFTIRQSEGTQELGGPPQRVVPAYRPAAEA